MKRNTYLAGIFCLLLPLSGAAQYFDTIELKSPPIDNLPTSQGNSQGLLIQAKGKFWISSGHTYNHFTNFKGQGGLVAVDKNGVVENFNKSRGNLPCDSVTDIQMYNDTVVTATTNGLFAFNGVQFAKWWPSGIIKASKYYSIFSFKNSMLLGCDKGIFLVNGGKVTDYTNIVQVKRFDWSQVLLNQNSIWVCTTDTIYRFNTISLKLSRFAVNSKSIRWQAGLSDNNLIVYNGGWDDALFGVKIIAGDSFYDIKNHFSRCEFRQTNGGIIYPNTTYVQGFSDGDAFSILAMDEFKAQFIEFKNNTIIGNYGLSELIRTTTRICAYGDSLAIFRNNKILFTSKINLFEKIKVKITHPFILDANNLWFSQSYNNFNSELRFQSQLVKSEQCLSTVFSRSLWVGAKKKNGDMITAITTYLQRGNDFYPGPLKYNGTTDSLLMLKYSRTWKIDLETVKKHNAEFLQNGFVTNVHPDIAQWPVYEIDGTDTIDLAPYRDVNRNGYYDPQNGDYPLMKGMQSVFFVMNDNGGPHSESGSQALKIQVNGLTYVYNCENSTSDSMDHILGNAAYVEYRIIYRGTDTLTDVYAGEWTDVDLGNYQDDYVGCAPKYQTGFTNNGDQMDEGYYGSGFNPGAQAVRVLQGPFAKPGDGIDNDNDGVIDEKDETCLLSGFMTHNNDADPSKGNPANYIGFYNLLRNRWLQGEPVVYKDSLVTDTVRFMYSHGMDPDHPNLNWTMKNGMWTEPPRDQRMILNCGPFVLKPGDEVPFHLVYFYVRNSVDSNQFPFIITAAERLKKVDDGETVVDCWMLNTEEISTDTKNGILKLYPNPVKQLLNIESQMKSGVISIIGLNGQLLMQQQWISGQTNSIQLNQLSPGMYFVSLVNSTERQVNRLIKLE